MSAVTEQVERALADLAPTSWLPTPSHVQTSVLSIGTYHTCVLVESGEARCVARMCRASQWGLSPASQLRREHLVLLDLTATGVAPEALTFIDGDPPMLLESYIEGEPFRYRDLVGVARSIARCHGQGSLLSTSTLEQQEPEAMLMQDGRRRLDRLGEASSDTAQMLREALGSLEVRPRERPWGRACIVHTDLIHSNILETTQGTRIIDWEGARLGPPEWDLAYFLSPVTLRWAPDDSTPVSADRRSEFFAAYAEAGERDVDEVRDGVERLLPFVVFRALCWCAEFAASSIHDPLADRRVLSFADRSYVEQTLAAVGAR